MAQAEVERLQCAARAAAGRPGRGPVPRRLGAQPGRVGRAERPGGREPGGGQPGAAGQPEPFDVRAAQAARRPGAGDTAIAPAADRLRTSRSPPPRSTQAAASLEAARVNQAESVIRAPFNGVVAQRLVSAGATVGTNSPIVSLVSKETEIVLQVEEARIGQVERNQPAQISVAAYPASCSRARSPASRRPPTPRSRTFAVRVYPNDPQGRLRDGMFAQVGLQTPARQALLVPVQAIVNRSGRNIVFVVGAGQPGPVPRGHRRHQRRATSGRGARPASRWARRSRSRRSTCCRTGRRSSPRRQP